MDAERYFVMSPGHYDVSRGEGCCYLLAFNPDDELRHVEFAGEVSNQNLHGFETPQMLIVTSRLMRGEAERLARAHKQADGLDAGVVLIDDIYNEFSSGTPHIMAIRRFARMLADRCPGRLRSVLLFGAAHWDNRGLTMEDEAAFPAIISYRYTFVRMLRVAASCLKVMPLMLWRGCLKRMLTGLT